MRYKLSFYNSGGYRDTTIIESAYDIKTDSKNQLCVIDNNQLIGGDDLIEELLNQARGWVESCTVVAVEKVSD